MSPCWCCGRKTEVTYGGYVTPSGFPVFAGTYHCTVCEVEWVPVNRAPFAY